MPGEFAGLLAPDFFSFLDSRNSCFLGYALSDLVCGGPCIGFKSFQDIRNQVVQPEVPETPEYFLILCQNLVFETKNHENS